MERNDGSLIGVDVRAGATACPGDCKGLRKLAELCRDRLKLGVVLYDSEVTVPFGERLDVAPLTCLQASERCRCPT